MGAVQQMKATIWKMGLPFKTFYWIREKDDRNGGCEVHKNYYEKIAVNSEQSKSRRDIMSVFSFDRILSKLNESQT